MPISLPAILWCGHFRVIKAVENPANTLKVNEAYHLRSFCESGTYAENHVADEQLVAHKPANCKP